MKHELYFVESLGTPALWRNPNLKRTNKEFTSTLTPTPVKCEQIFEYNTFSDISRTDHIRVYRDVDNHLALLTICEYYPPFSLDTASWYSNEKCFGYRNIYILREIYSVNKKIARNITYALEEAIDGTWEIEIIIDHERYGWLPLLCRTWVCQECKTKEEALLAANINPSCYDMIDVRRNLKPLRRYTPEIVTSLAPSEIFVFGSNIQGKHRGGAAAFATKNFGAQWGVGEGITGQCYALPTMEGGVDYIRDKVNNFLNFASKHHEYTFLVTPIACGIAGFTPEQIAPLFMDALGMSNIILPKCFIEIIDNQKQ